VLATVVAMMIWVARTPAGSTGAQPEVVDKDKIREILNAAFVFPYGELIAMGEKVFPAYEAILAAPENSREVQHIFFTLRQTKGDRRRFVEPALRALTHSNIHVREQAALLLGEIGTNTEASPLVALLSDKDSFVAKAAGKSLAAIGGPREVLAMDVWLRGVPAEKPGKQVVDLDNEKPIEAPRRSDDTDERLRKRVREYRDELQKRLDAEKSKDEKKPRRNDGSK
jgi:hypothetical protein